MPNKSLTTITKIRLVTLVLGTLSLGLVSYVKNHPKTGAPPYGVPESEVPESTDYFENLRNWQRPEGPAKVGLQIGHYKNSEVPEELEKLRGNTGSKGGGITEVELNQKIVEETASLLRQNGVEVDILPTTVPPGYIADVFVSIHADGNTDPRKSGFKIAGPWRDITGHADDLVAIMEDKYQQITGLTKDDNITRNMRGYYAFSWWRNEHAIHPMTVGVIVETGFITNYSDRNLLYNQTNLPAKAIAESLIEYLKTNDLLD